MANPRTPEQQLIPKKYGRRRSLLRWPIRILLLSLLPILFVSLVLLSAITDTPANGRPVAINPNSVAQAKSVVRRSLRQYSNYNSYIILGFNNDELDSLVALATHAIPRLKGATNIDDSGINYTLSWELPNNPLGRYITLGGQLPSNEQGLDLGNIEIGFLTIPNSLINWTAEQLLNLLLGEQQGSTFINSIKAVSTYQNVAQIHAEPPADIEQRLDKISQRLSTLSGDAGLFADTNLTRHYYQFLSKQGRKLYNQQPLSLAAFLNPLFKEAANRSDNDAIAHNKAAILALGVYLGSEHFQKAVGNISSPPAYPAPPLVTLGGRIDLRLHFVFSAVLKILSDEGISLAAGEVKELLDSQSGGSGFSFADLAADKAGIIFAAKATENEDEARHFQKSFSHPLTEKQLFPDIGDLPEGISESRFSRDYRDLNSPVYKAAEKLIEKRIQALHLYR